MSETRPRTYAVKIASNGRICIPAELRRQLGWTDEQKLWLEIGTIGMVLSTPEQAMERARERVGQLFESDEAGVDAFIAERLRATAADDSEDRGTIAA